MLLMWAETTFPRAVRALERSPSRSNVVSAPRAVTLLTVLRAEARSRAQDKVSTHNPLLDDIVSEHGSSWGLTLFPLLGRPAGGNYVATRQLSRPRLTSKHSVKQTFYRFATNFDPRLLKSVDPTAKEVVDVCWLQAFLRFPIIPHFSQ